MWSHKNPIYSPVDSLRHGWNVEIMVFNPTMTGSWLTYPSEKYESQLGWLFPIYGKIKNVPNRWMYVQHCSKGKQFMFQQPIGISLKMSQKNWFIILGLSCHPPQLSWYPGSSSLTQPRFGALERGPASQSWTWGWTSAWDNAWWMGRLAPKHVLYH